MLSYLFGSTKILNGVSSDIPKAGRSAAPAIGDQSGKQPDSNIARDLNKTILKLYGSHLSEEGTKVDYKAMHASPVFQEFVERTQELSTVSNLQSILMSTHFFVG